MTKILAECPRCGVQKTIRVNYESARQVWSCFGCSLKLAVEFKMSRLVPVKPIDMSQYESRELVVAVTDKPKQKKGKK
jgi:transposase-like protein